jgi:glutamyl-tRNA reductase
MEIAVVGLNHTTAPVTVRECLAYSSEQARESLRKLCQVPDVEEALLLSTCNRTEVLASVRCLPAPVGGVKEFLAEDRGVPLKRFEPHLYIHTGEDAVRHVFRVASSLDSMVLGEPQILGQIKESYRLAAECGTTGCVLNRLMHKSFSVAKRVRRETGIGGHAVSVSYAAVELAKKIFDTLEGRKVLLVGAGEMAELAVEHLIRNHARDIRVANRTFERAVLLARRFSGAALKIEEIPDCLKAVDIIISSTGAPGYVITRDQVKAALKARKNRPLFFIDIALPRDIDPDINRLPNTYVYDLDDLAGVVDQNVAERKKESVRAEAIVDEGVIAFARWFRELDVVPAIVGLRSKADALCGAELAKTLAQLRHLSPEDKAAVERLASSLVNKLLHDPICFLKNGMGTGQRKRENVAVFSRVFGLGETEGEE